MMLKDKLYHIKQMDYSESELRAEIALNENHSIFSGHFPDIPVLPGVTMMQMIKELLEEAEKSKMRLKKAANMKFLQMINPLKNKYIQVVVKVKENTEDSMKISGQILAEEHICFKISAQLIKL